MGVLAFLLWLVIVVFTCFEADKDYKRGQGRLATTKICLTSIISGLILMSIIM